MKTFTDALDRAAAALRIDMLRAGPIFAAAFAAIGPFRAITAMGKFAAENAMPDVAALICAASLLATTRMAWSTTPVEALGSWALCEASARRDDVERAQLLALHRCMRAQADIMASENPEGSLALAWIHLLAARKLALGGGAYDEQTAIASGLVALAKEAEGRADLWNDVEIWGETRGMWLDRVKKSLVGPCPVCHGSEFTPSGSSCVCVLKGGV